MKEIITEYGKAVLIFSVAGLIIFIVLGIFMWSKSEIASDVYAKEDSINYNSDKEFKAVINSDVDLNVMNNIKSNTEYKINEIITGADYLNVIKVENPDMVNICGDSLTFKKSGVANIYVDARLNSGESARTWLAVGVDG